ncbi:MAG TPA: hypothetical protein P5262_03750 [Candidatus Moranbacteria bacterium]|nr:hypothetical protein [Candidatus Moranbacteria bacterium]
MSLHTLGCMEESFLADLFYCPAFRTEIIKLHLRKCAEDGRPIEEALAHIYRKYGAVARREAEIILRLLGREI